MHMFGYQVNIVKDICEHMVAHATISVDPTPIQYSSKQTEPQIPLHTVQFKTCLIHND